MYNNDNGSETDDTNSLSDESEYGENLYLDMDSESTSDNESQLSDSSDNDSIIIEADDFSDDEDEEIALEHIYADDVIHLDSEKFDGEYYIGLCKYMPRPKLHLMLNSVSPRTFFRYNYYHVLKYLYYYSSVRLFQPKIEIMKLAVLEDQTYSVVIKTHWIRLIQRHWRSMLKKRNEIIRGRKHPAALLWREVTGKFPHGLNVFPSLIGLMRHYSR
jgi:hypothetical protein